ncbi:MAG: hypothetical protein ACOY0S_00680 [Patescibacteria group bacterium]
MKKKHGSKRSWHAHHRRRKHKNLLFLLVSLVVAFFLARNATFHNFLLNLNNFGYLGAFFGGMLFVSTFAMPTGAVILFTLAQRLSPLEIGIVAGLGAVVTDMLTFRFAKDDLSDEVKIIYNELGGHHFNKVLYSKYFSWTLPVVGALIIASPLPDELGVSLIGLSQMKVWEFLPLSFLLNATGIFLVVSASLLF